MKTNISITVIATILVLGGLLLVFGAVGHVEINENTSIIQMLVKCAAGAAMLLVGIILIPKSSGLPPNRRRH